LRIWNSYKEIEKAVDTIVRIYQETKSLPKPLVEAYNINLQHAKRGIVSRFYEKLAEEAPELLRFFPPGE
jgi:hypothetical protein